MKEVNIFDENGMINKKLTVGMYVEYSYEVEPLTGRPYTETGHGCIIKAKYDTKYNDRECDEYLIETKEHYYPQEIYGRDVDKAWRYKQ